MFDITILVIIGIVLALAFDFGNGFNDAANAISTVVATRVLSFRSAVLLSAFFNLIAAFVFTTAVAKTVGTGIVNHEAIDIYVIFATLLSSIIWIYGLTWFGIPISASHSLIGGLVGAATAAGGLNIVVWPGLTKVLAFVFIAPILGMIGAYIFSLFVLLCVKKIPPLRIREYFKKLQLISVSIYSLGHGANDAQKTMGIIALLLFTGGFLGDKFDIPFWVVLISHITIALGTLIGGFRVVKTMATKITKIRPIDGFCAETAGAGTIIGSSILGIPVSTTHVIGGSISGVGVLKKYSAVSWKVARKIIIAWFITIPLTALGAAVIYHIFGLFL